MEQIIKCLKNLSLDEVLQNVQGESQNLECI